ncbi:hypothetical protein C2845_PM06G12660 [Panicum miliaceum]|uniref:Gnk2-homologous domain-containing protein n=1 Tax=Panicum miliaceum TaxID=4540 RepID=A0A3L6R5V9_PANMI|nr:hypothetical protein C2845_PM06G12660 [Panicum miliaceum]
MLGRVTGDTRSAAVLRRAAAFHVAAGRGWTCKNDTEAVTSVLTPSPCLLLGSADRLQCEGYNIERYKKAHAVGSSSGGGPLLELNAQMKMVKLLLIVAVVLQFTTSSSSSYWELHCAGGNFTPGSPSQQLAARSRGKTTTVYAIAQCRRDSRRSACESCIRGAFEDTRRLCRFKVGAFVFRDLCTVGYYDEKMSFFPNTAPYHTVESRWDRAVISIHGKMIDDAVRELAQDSGDDKAAAHRHKKEIAIWVSVAVAVLVGVAVVIAIVLFCRKKKRLSRNNLPSGEEGNEIELEDMAREEAAHRVDSGQNAISRVLLMMILSVKSIAGTQKHMAIQFSELVQNQVVLTQFSSAEGWAVLSQKDHPVRN